ncbi:hypothetical protein NSA50_16995 [Clostridium sp. DSM 100503]|uniref:hypothetical protein n=1 Tax=Clostridium sp. DSM 100503 TaxID=2963282 RepID=UPI00214A7375|nr:hypothetical protein [Clostridium sp. DSM 100503]MCR1952723.1 hypothetical protein [Clostridium sp. DSM 100503]
MIVIFSYYIAKGGVVDMLEISLIGVIAIILINLILKHNKDFNLEINLKLLGLNIKINSKEKRYPSGQDK